MNYKENDNDWRSLDVIRQAIMPALAGALVQNGVLSYANVNGFIPSPSKSLEIKKDILSKGDYLPYDLLGKWGFISGISGITAAVGTYYVATALSTPSTKLTNVVQDAGMEDRSKALSIG